MEGEDAKMEHVYAVIMAGGKSERFWPMGRKNSPKQLLPLTGERSMLQETVDRIRPLIAGDHIIVMTNSAIAEKIRSQLPELPEENIIVEPEARDTAPCIALAAAQLFRRDPDSVMCVMPADHVIGEAEVFRRSLGSACTLAQKEELLITLGIPVTYPATGYGYIKEGKKISPEYALVAEFKEKPSLEVARQFMEQQEYFWNSGIFIWKSAVILKEFETFQPDMYKVIQSWMGGAAYEDSFKNLQRISIDHAILEKTRKAAVCRAPFSWNDIGSWKGLREFRESKSMSTETGNNIYTLDSSGNLILTDDGSAVAVIGLNNIAVIKSGNGILVCSLDDEQKVKDLVRRMPEELQ